MNVGQLEVLALHKYIGREGRMEDGGTRRRGREDRGTGTAGVSQKDSCIKGGKRTTRPVTTLSVLRDAGVCVKLWTGPRWPIHGAQDPPAGQTVGRALGGRVIHIGDQEPWLLPRCLLAPLYTRARRSPRVLRRYLGCFDRYLGCSSIATSRTRLILPRPVLAQDVGGGAYCVLIIESQDSPSPYGASSPQSPAKGT